MNTIIKRFFKIIKHIPMMRRFAFAIHNTFPGFYARTRVKITGLKKTPTLIPVLLKDIHGGSFRLWIDYSESMNCRYVTGIQRVVHNIVTELSQVALNQTQDSCHALETVQPQDVLLMLDSSWLSIIEGNFDAIFKAFHEKGAKILTVIYDLNPIDFPNFFTQDFKPIFSCWLDRTIKESDGFICISKSAAERFRSYLNNNKYLKKNTKNTNNANNSNGTNSTNTKNNKNNTIKYWHLGSNIKAFVPVNSFENPEAKLQFFSDDKKTFLAVGTLEPRKGHALLLDAFELLWQKGYDIRLCIAGKYGWLVQDLLQRIKMHPEHGSRLIYLEEPSDAELFYCYQKSSALIIASEAEGFGLPIVEASQFGIPIFASDIAVFREIGQDHIAYFKVGDVSSLESVIEKWLIDPNKKQWPDSRQIKSLTWSESAAELLKVIQEIK